MQARDWTSKNSRQVTFVSDRFSPIPLPNAVNGVLGHDLAGWLRGELISAGFEAGEVIGEDYGYGFWIRLDGAHYWISMSRVEADAGRIPSQWMVGIDYDPGCLYVWRLRKRPAPDAVARIATAVAAILAREPSIRAVEWTPAANSP